MVLKTLIEADMKPEKFQPKVEKAPENPQPSIKVSNSVKFWNAFNSETQKMVELIEKKQAVKPKREVKEVTILKDGRLVPIRPNREINDTILIREGPVKQILGCDKDSYFILDDKTDEIGYGSAPLIKVVTGAHQEEIVTLQYSPQLSLIATGTVDGEVAIWDYEMSRLLGYALGHKKQEITGIHFLWPYPMMVTTAMDG
jgi:hypothetical protein